MPTAAHALAVTSGGFGGSASGPFSARIERLLEYVVGLLGVIVILLLAQLFFALL